MKALDAAEEEYEEAKRVASEAKAQHAAAEAAVWAEDEAYSIFEIAYKHMWMGEYSAIIRFEAEQLAEYAMECFAEGK